MWKNAVNEVIDIIYRTNYKFVCIKGDEGFFSSKAYAGLHSYTTSKFKLPLGSKNFSTKRVRLS